MNPSAVFVRRWSVVPLTHDPDRAVVLQVVASRVTRPAAHDAHEAPIHAHGIGGLGVRVFPIPVEAPLGGTAEEILHAPRVGGVGGGQSLEWELVQ